MLLDGEYDSGDAIMTIHAGAGGLDSQDWAEILYRMYMRWAESNNFTVKLIDELPDQEAGIKSVTISINGDYAYGYLKGEQGVHRLVRISPFASAKRRHKDNPHAFRNCSQLSDRTLSAHEQGDRNAGPPFKAL